jgi:tetratricopeptide (TPR) repeat protein
LANLFEHKDRRVIPNWRSFGNTVVLGELNSFQNQRETPIIQTTIDEYIIDWRVNRTIIHASDLVSSAVVNNFKNSPDVHEAAKFILDNKQKATLSQVSIAESIFEIKTEDINYEFKSIENNSLLLNTTPLFTIINDIKEQLKRYSNNPILYVELARYYSILGQENKAISAMKSAIYLAPTNRFVLRSATRLFAHYHNDFNGYLNYMHSILMKNQMTNRDPWLMSAEISIATVLNKTSKFMKKGINMIESKSFSPFNLTELASSLGTVELLQGTRKKSKSFFNVALLNPNDNSLAQMEWASSKDIHLDIDTSAFDVKLNYEALALENYHKNNYVEAVENSINWFKDMPFSRRPIMFGASLASSFLKDHKKAISILKAGLISNPNDPQIINNMAYSYALSNNPNEAIDILNTLRYSEPLDDMTQICLLATRGLTFFRLNQPEIGRSLYLEAISESRINNYPQLNWIAILNYTREELLSGSNNYIEHLIGEVGKIPIRTKDVELSMLKDEVLNLYEIWKTKKDQ